MHLLPFLSSAVMVFFVGAVFYRYLKGRRMHTLMWSIGLALYAAGTFCEAYLAVEYHPALLRLWYLSGAMLTAAWLAQGSFYLLIRKPGVAHGLLAGLGVATLAAIGLVFAAPLTTAEFHTHLAVSAQYKDLLVRNGAMVFLTIVLNLYGTAGLVGGAAYSAWLFWRKRVLPHRMLGNLLIAFGALMPAGAGTLIRAGLGDYLYVSELLGAVVMFAGFMLATQSQPAERRAPAAVRAG